MNDQNESPIVDVVDIVRTQHQQVQALLHAVASATGDRSADFQALVRLLTIHENAEAEVIYPALRKLGLDGARVADARREEEAAAKDTLTELEQMDLSSPEFEDEFRMFSIDVERHAYKEESEVLPLLLGRVGVESRRALGQEFLHEETVASK